MEPSTLNDLLDEADLSNYEHAMRSVLRLRSAEDVLYVDEKDLSDIGMSRPEQKRLKATYVHLYPKASLFNRLKKILGKNEIKRKERVSSDQEQHVISLEKIVLCRELGKGEFGCVFQAAWNFSGNEQIQVAVKCISSEKLLASPTNFLQEASIMHKMRHDCVVRLYGVVLDTKAVMLVSELAPCGSLLNCLQNFALRESLSVDVLCIYMQQIALGMEYLSNQRLIHRDLAARNVLVFSANEVKISDFGLSRSLGMGEDYYRSEFSESLRLPIAWCAPESINFLRFTWASDVWSFGVTLFEMFSYGQMPWSGFTGGEILSAIDYPAMKRLERPDCCPYDVYKMMLQCWTHKPEERPTFTDIVQSLPEVFPQTLVAVRTCDDGVIDHLQFSKNDIIIVLDKSPPAYPDGYYWKGCVKSGRTGLFRPDATVAKLGAEIPSNKLCTNGLMHTTVSLDALSKKEYEKNKDKNKKKKIIISEPQGDLRHTCHVGADGTGFGSFQANKSDLSPHITASTIRPFVPIKVQSRSPSLPPTPHPEVSPSLSRNSIELNKQLVPGSKEVNIVNSTHAPQKKTPPLLPTAPKPKKLLLQLPVASTMNYEMNRTLSSGSLNKDDLFILPRNKFFHKSTDKLLSDQQTSSSLGMSASMSEHQLEIELAKKGDNTRSIQTKKCTKINDSKRDAVENGHSQSVCRLMSDNELEKLEKKVFRDHKKVDKLLDEEMRKEEMLRKNVCNDHEELADTSRSFSSAVLRRNSSEWTEDAQNAYKILVQCGDDLKLMVSSTSLNDSVEKSDSLKNENVQDSIQPDDKNFKIPKVNTEERLSRIPPPVPPKPKKKPISLILNEERSENSSANEIKMRDENIDEVPSMLGGVRGGFASTVAKTTLLCRSIKDDIVMI